MRILIEPPDDTSGAYHVGDEVRRALEVLNAAYIHHEGGGTIASDGVVTGVIMLRCEDDLSKALARLHRAGIKASRL
jgi:hypothetical protein